MTALLALSACSEPLPRQLVWVDIPAGAPLTVVAESLAVHGIVARAGEFERYVRRGRLESELRPGVYHLRTGMRPAEVMWAVRRFPPMARIVVRERMTVVELARELQQMGLRVDRYAFERTLFGVVPRDTTNLATAIAVMTVVAFAAAYLPARRASRVDPMVALRYE